MGVLILFGGGLSIVGAINSAGLAAWLGTIVGALTNWPVLLLDADGATRAGPVKTSARGLALFIA